MSGPRLMVNSLEDVASSDDTSWSESEKILHAHAPSFLSTDQACVPRRHARARVLSASSGPF
jgi:hypothetical protein